MTTDFFGGGFFISTLLIRSVDPPLFSRSAESAIDERKVQGNSVRSRDSVWERNYFKRWVTIEVGSSPERAQRFANLPKS